jgi:transposase
MLNTFKVNESSDSVNRICAGIDVHRDFACVTIIERRTSGDTILGFEQFSTVKKEMLRMREWLLENKVTVAGIESTGKYWYAVFNALESNIQLNLYNARNIKNLPGKKTDRADSTWIAKITLNDSLVSSFIPDAQIRDARTVARFRKSLVQNRTRYRQQAHGLLESAGIKISSLISDLYGTSGKNILTLIADNLPYNEIILEKKVRNQIRNKIPALMTALDGYVRQSQRELLNTLLTIDNFITIKIQEAEQKLKSILLDTPDKTEILNRIVDLPGFSETSALILLAEVGFDLTTFPTIKHFCSWAGLCPGSHESAGKNKSGKIQTRQKYLRGLMIEIALVSVCRKDTYLRAKYFSLKARIGANKAVIAIAHKLLKAVYLAIKENKPYYELTAEYVSISQFAKDQRTLNRISSRIGKESLLVLVNGIESTELQ